MAEKSKRSMLSEYLTKSLRATSDDVQILQAIDLTDLSPPHEIDQKIQESDFFKKAGLESSTVVPILSSLRGAALRIMVGEESRGQLRIDFDQDIGILEPIAKELVIAGLR